MTNLCLAICQPNLQSGKLPFTIKHDSFNFFFVTFPFFSKINIIYIFFFQSYKTVKYLLEKGANVCATNNLGQTPLHLLFEDNCRRPLFSASSDHVNNSVPVINKVTEIIQSERHCFHTYIKVFHCRFHSN